MERFCAVLVFTLSLNGLLGQSLSTSIGFQLPRFGQFQINQQEFISSTGLKYEIGEISDFEKLDGFDILFRAMVNHKRFYFTMDFNIFDGYENFKVPVNSEKWVYDPGAGENVIETRSEIKSVSIEHIGIGFGAMIKISKQPNSFLIGSEIRFISNSSSDPWVIRPTGLTKEDTDNLNAWVSNQKSEIRMNFSVAYKWNKLIPFVKYTPTIRLQKIEPGISFSKIDFGFFIVGHTFPILRKRQLYIPEE